MTENQSNLDASSGLLESTIYRAHKIRLVPNKDQEAQLRKACGVRRFAYNWALAAWNEQYDAHLADKENIAKPNWAELSRRFNAIKDEKWPWIREVSGVIPAHAIQDLSRAWDKFWRGLKTGCRVGKPVFAQHGRRERFYVRDEQLKIDGKFIQIGKGFTPIRMRESLRLDGRVVSANVSLAGGEWYVSIRVEINHHATPHSHSGTYLGVDVGVSHLASTSDGQHFNLPTGRLLDLQKKLVSQERKLSRRWSGQINKGHADKALRDSDGNQLPKSKRFVKQAERVAKLHRKIARVREHALHAATTAIVAGSESIFIEELPVSRMTRSRKGKGRAAKAGLNRAILNSSLGEFRRQLEYKAESAGGCVFAVDPAYTSQACHECGHVDADNRKTQSSFRCVACGHSDNADVNAARNILKKGREMCLPNRPRKRRTHVENRKTSKAPAELASSRKREASKDAHRTEGGETFTAAPAPEPGEKP